MLSGSNFQIDRGAGLENCGFITTRFVEAADPQEAELAAVASVRRREDIKPMLRNPANNPPLLDLEEIEQIDSFEGIENLEQGLIWYKEDSA